MLLSASVESDFDLIEFWPSENPTHQHSTFWMGVSTGLRACMEEEGKVIRVCEISLHPCPSTMSLGASVTHCEWEHSAWWCFLHVCDWMCAPSACNLGALACLEEYPRWLIRLNGASDHFGLVQHPVLHRPGWESRPVRAPRVRHSPVISG